MSTQEDQSDDAALAGEYVLHLLDADTRSAFESRMTTEPALRGLVRDWDESFVLMAESIPAVTPPAAIKDNLQKALFPDAVKPRRSMWAWLVGSVAIAAIAVGAVVLTPALLQDPVFDPTFTASVAAEDGTLVIAARFISETNALELSREAGAARPGRVLELWLIAEGADAPVSLGVLPDEADTRIEVSPDIAQRLAGGVLAISDDPPGGSPTGAPTGEVLAVGRVVNI